MIAPKERERPLCGCCWGSGEGLMGGGRCSHCKGSGVEPTEADREREEQANADAYDAWKERRRRDD